MNLSPTAQQSSVSILDVLFFIRQNDTNEEACGEYNDYALIGLIKEAMARNTLLFAKKHDEDLIGIVVGIPDYATKTMSIPFVVTTDKSVILLFLLRFMLQYPDWKLNGYRRGKFKEWNLAKIKQLERKLKQHI